MHKDILRGIVFTSVRSEVLKEALERVNNLESGVALNYVDDKIRYKFEHKELTMLDVMIKAREVINEELLKEEYWVQRAKEVLGRAENES